jgi:hypothetical protein
MPRSVEGELVHGTAEANDVINDTCGGLNRVSQLEIMNTLFAVRARHRAIAVLQMPFEVDELGAVLGQAERAADSRMT